ncbi:aspartate/glutamate racemase family protein [Microtetraspora malaysiensis]|uniref:aspartate/glutamate racemase family protein n=1 Tax=Microtetraspora malaysiensis TaxID=161358 RepID=UPI000835669F|nr:aspartate/glutamate racemase family protein [Microtetraspora malaysiensis]
MSTTRIAVLNCNTSTSISEVIEASARQAAEPGTEVITLTPSWGVESAEGYLDSQLAAVAMLDTIRNHDGEYDAVVLAGYGEAGREAFRELLDVPVVDITDAAAHVALMVAPRYAVITSLSRTVVQIEDSLRNAGVLTHCVGVRAVELPVVSAPGMTVEPDGALVTGARRLVESGAEALVLGCAGFSGLARALSGYLGLPVIDPVMAGVTMAESLVRMRLSSSKVCTYARPRPKARPGWDTPVSETAVTGIAAVS